MLADKQLPDPEDLARSLQWRPNLNAGGAHRDDRSADNREIEAGEARLDADRPVPASAHAPGGFRGSPAAVPRIDNCTETGRAPPHVGNQRPAPHSKARGGAAPEGAISRAPEAARRSQRGPSLVRSNCEKSPVVTLRRRRSCQHTAEGPLAIKAPR